jgi:hypothetical protein
VVAHDGGHDYALDWPYPLLMQLLFRDGDCVTPVGFELDSTWPAVYDQKIYFLVNAPYLTDPDQRAASPLIQRGTLVYDMASGTWLVGPAVWVGELSQFALHVDGQYVTGVRTRDNQPVTIDLAALDLQPATPPSQI